MSMSDCLLRDIEAHYRDTCPYTGVSELSPQVREAIAAIDRCRFVSDDNRDLANYDSALPIGHGQTISQPFVVALMTQLLSPQPYFRVLEIGTGSGYQAAVLAQLVEQVYSVEIVDELASSASERLAELGIDNVVVRQGDGYAGWPDEAPYDGVLITAATPSIPQPLADQVRVGGRIVAPLGTSGGVQQLVVAEKTTAGELDLRNILPVSFVPFTRAH